jgi:hypothetical protein
VKPAPADSTEAAVQPPAPAVGGKSAASQAFAERYDPTLRGRPRPPPEKPPTGQRVKFADNLPSTPPVRQTYKPRGASSPKAAAPTPVRRPLSRDSLSSAGNQDVFASSAAPPATTGFMQVPESEPLAASADHFPQRPKRTSLSFARRDVDDLSASSSNESDAAGDENAKQFSAPLRRKWDAQRHAAHLKVQEAADGKPSPSADAKGGDLPAPVASADSSGSDSEATTAAPKPPVKRPATLRPASRSPASSSPSSPTAGRPSKVGGETPVPSVGEPAATVGPRVRPSSASRAGPAPPERMLPVAIPSDNVIASLDSADAKELVAALEHKLRVARQTVLIRQLQGAKAATS